jgi:hypothetical protein
LNSDDRSKGFVEIQASNLRIAFDHDSAFVLLEFAFGISLDAENPFQRYCPFAGR